MFGRDGIYLYQARQLFDMLLQEFPELHPYLSLNASIVASEIFEKAVAKIQGNDERELTGNERRAVRHLQLDSSMKVGVPDRNNEDESKGTDFAHRVLDSAEVTKRARLGTYECNYRCLLHSEAHSNVVERLFSRAKLSMTPERRNMNPCRLESLLSLRANYMLWGVYTLHNALQEDPDVPVENEK